MNLVTAVLVEASINGGRRDRDLQKNIRKQRSRKLAPVIRSAFHTLDADQSGGITREEVVQASDHLPEILKSVLDHYSVAEIFDIIDMDNTGTLEETEFVEGLIQMATSDLEPDMMQLFSLLRLNRKDTAALDSLVLELSHNLRALCKSMGKSWLEDEATEQTCDAAKDD